MSIEVSIQNLADAINNLASGIHKSNSSFMPGVVGEVKPLNEIDATLTRVEGNLAKTASAVTAAPTGEVDLQAAQQEAEHIAAEKKEAKRLAAEAKAQQAEREAAAIALAQEAAEKLKSEKSAAISGEHISASEPEWKKGHPEFDAIFNTETGSIAVPFLLLPRDNKIAILTEFGLQKLSECPRNRLDALAALIKASSAS